MRRDRAEMWDYCVHPVRCLAAKRPVWVFGAPSEQEGGISELVRSRRFDRLAALNRAVQSAPVAQLDRASVFGTEGWGFESLRV